MIPKDTCDTNGVPSWECANEGGLKCSGMYSPMGTGEYTLMYTSYIVTLHLAVSYGCI